MKFGEIRKNSNRITSVCSIIIISIFFTLAFSSVRPPALLGMRPNGDLTGPNNVVADWNRVVYLAGLTVENAENGSVPPIIIKRDKPIQWHNILESFSPIFSLHVVLAVKISELLNSEPSFDVAIYGMISLFEVFCLFILSFIATSTSRSTVIILVLSLCTCEYLKLLNSLYVDSYALILLCIVCGLSMLTKGNKSFFLLAFFTLLLSTIKPQFVLTSFCLLPFFIYNYTKFRTTSWGMIARFIIFLVTIFISFLWTVSHFHVTSAQLSIPKYYNRLFIGLIRADQSNFEVVAQAFKLPERSRKFAGKDYWRLSQEQRREAEKIIINNKNIITWKNIIKFYVFNPEVFFEQFVFSFSQLSAEGRWIGKLSFNGLENSHRFLIAPSQGLFSILRQKLFSIDKYLALAMLLLPVPFLASRKERNPELLALVTFLTLFVILQVFSCFFGEGRSDINRHLMLARFAFDIVLGLYCLILVQFGCRSLLIAQSQKI